MHDNFNTYFFLVVTDGGRSRGYGFVRFGSESDQKRALTEMQNHYGLGYRALRVSLATPKRPEDNLGGPTTIGGVVATSLFAMTPDNSGNCMYFE